MNEPREVPNWVTGLVVVVVAWLFIVLMLFIIVFEAEGGEAYFKNGGFEVHSGNVALPWDLAGGGTSSWIDDTVYRSGGHSYKSKRITGESGTAAYTLDNRGKELYELSVYVKAESGASCGVRLFTNPGQVQRTQVTTGSTSWVLVETSYWSSGGDSGVYVLLGAFPPLEKMCWYDDVDFVVASRRDVWQGLADVGGSVPVLPVIGLSGLVFVAWRFYLKLR